MAARTLSDSHLTSPSPQLKSILLSMYCAKGFASSHRQKVSKQSLRHSGRMPKIVHISGAADAFYHALADRLHRAGATLTEDPREAEVTVGIGEGASGDVAIVPAHVGHGEADLVVRIHDLLIPEGAIDWQRGHPRLG